MKDTRIPNADYWYEMIAAWKQGELSQQQEQELFLWKEEKPEHAVFFEETESSWSGSRETVSFPDFDASIAWAKVKMQTIDKAENKRVSLLQTIWEAPFARAAAAVLVLITVSWVLSNVVIHKPTFTDLQAGSGLKEFLLPDSSKVWLRDSTTIRYSSDYGKEERMVFLDGEAFFEVRKNANKPFTVMSYRSRVIVKGTSFLVRSRKNDTIDRVEVEEGKVAVLQKYSMSGEELLLTKGMKGSVSEIGVLRVLSEPSTNTAAWRTHRLIFENTPLKNVLKDVKELSNADIVLEDPISGSCRFTGEFDNAKPEEIVQVLAVSMNLQIEQQGNRYILKGRACDK